MAECLKILTNNTAALHNKGAWMEKHLFDIIEDVEPVDNDKLAEKTINRFKEKLGGEEQ